MIRRPPRSTLFPLHDALPISNSPRGSFSFNGTLSGYAPADFILGIPNAFTTPGPEVHGHVAEWRDGFFVRSEEHTSELQSHSDLVCRLLLEKKKKNITRYADN